MFFRYFDLSSNLHRDGSRSPRRRGPDPPRMYQHTILPEFPKNLREIETMFGYGGGGNGTPHRSANVHETIFSGD